MRKIRITGGEPLVRKNIPYLIKLIKDIEGIKDLSLTTNGILLEQYADALADAGLDRVNISLDSLKAGQIQGDYKRRRYRCCFQRALKPRKRPVLIP